MVYGSWNIRCDRHFCHFGTFLALTIWKIKILKNEKNAWRYYHFTQVCHKWQSYDVWFLRYRAWRREFFVILDHFLHFYHPSNPKNQTFEKMKKTSGDIIILHMCITNDNHVMYGSWDMEIEGQNLLSFWTIFCPFTSLTTQKIKILKKWKKCLEISSFYTCIPKIMITWCTVPEIRCATDRRTDRKSNI